MTPPHTDNNDIIERLRIRTVPTGHPVHSWSQELGMTHNIMLFLQSA